MAFKCEQDCSTNCLGSLCEKVNGKCHECIPGKHGTPCDQSCPGKCKDMICERDTGSCKGCIAGRYDVTCLLTCPVTCKDFLCNQQSGHCLDCYSGKHGVVCGADCPDTCTDNICNKDDGQCIATDLTTADSKMTIIAVLAVVCGLLFTALIALAVVVFFLRKRQSRKNLPDKDTEQAVPDTGYTSISPRQEETPHVYEMMVI
ncbi:cell death abnormality protein 1-like [Pecten maximus]|uniref:cell death abnormality protein 1-like n=1 Tax=Pecten maximus TaxID=6579 RepID=UPI00145911BB|nr:cell death abnormality protein 1-like [Pecten maximus]